MNYYRPNIIFIMLLLGFSWLAYCNPTYPEYFTLKAKIGQMIMIGFRGKSLKPDDPIVQDIMAQRIGGVILFDKNMETNQYDWNIENAQQLKQLTYSLQSYAKKAAQLHHNHLYPLLIAIDVEGGRVNRLNARYGFPVIPSQEKVGNSPLKDANVAATQIAKLLQSLGINMDFSPIVDINLNKDNPVIGKLGRSFSSVPDKVAAYAAVYSEAFRRHNIVCVYKHFPGHGNSRTDSHEGMVDITRSWSPEELIPYKKLFQQKNCCEFVMPGHLIHSGLDASQLPATLSKKIISGLLRNQLGFKGLIITDDLEMKAISEHYTLLEAIKLAINAGNNMILYGNRTPNEPEISKEIITDVYVNVLNGAIPKKNINNSFEKIYALKTALRSQSIGLKP